MYLTISQVNQILNTPHYTLPFTESLFQYALYRGRYNARVFTVRFNTIPSLSEDFIFSHLYRELQSRFPEEPHLRASLKYDLLMKNTTQTPATYYIWRANSNHYNFNNADEVLMSNTYESLFQFVNNCTTIDIDNLDIFFQNSSVTIDRVLALVFSFVTC
jgi:hypothetical protein